MDGSYLRNSNRLIRDRFLVNANEIQRNSGLANFLHLALIYVIIPFMIVKERCPGIGAYAKDRAGNPGGSCIVCGKYIRLTKRGTIRFHKRAVPVPPVQQPVQQRQDSLDAQLATVRHLANQHGCYDAADFIRDILERGRR